MGLISRHARQVIAATVSLIITMQAVAGCGDSGFGFNVINQSHRPVAIYLDGGLWATLNPGAESGSKAHLWDDPANPEAKIEIRDPATKAVLFSKRVSPADLDARGRFVLILVDSNSGVTEKKPPD